MKQTADFYTADLPGIPVIKKRGRPPLGLVAMSNAERVRKHRKARRNNVTCNEMGASNGVDGEALADTATPLRPAL